MKKQIYRTIWLIFYIPVFVLEVIVFLIILLLYPFIGAFYFIKTGSVEQVPFKVLEAAIYIDSKYKGLLEKIKNES